ncbi:uncharacterized protein METZ01_LOCUS35825 [marine metagenome]|jgi:hypothetical protein|uniref:Uncharacterized protein n=1 Tax=marine metagenome TaxID=408172 RepID=A0A381QUB5_9ZZZZ
MITVNYSLNGRDANERLYCEILSIVKQKESNHIMP